MRRLVLCLLLTAAPAPIAAQAFLPPGPTLSALLERVRADDPASVDRFWEMVRARGTPLLDRVPADTTRMLAAFVYRSGDARNVVLENGVNGWAGVLNQLQRVPGTDIWHITVNLPTDIRLGYVFRENDNLIPWHREPDQATRWSANRPDPLNPAGDSAQGRRSLLLGPRAEPDVWSSARPAVAAGSVEDVEVESRAMGASRRVSVYTPPVASTAGLPLLLVFDGPVYRRTVRIPTIIDNLFAAGGIEAPVVLFVAQQNRNAELEPNDAFTRFVADELIPWARARYGLSSDPARTVLMGSSHGGLAAVAIALERPGTIGGVIAQSASLWWRPGADTAPEYFARRVARESRRPVRFYLEVGSFEIDRTRGGQPGQVDVSRHFRDVLVAKEYDVVYHEFPGGHEYLSWRVTAPRALRHFFARRWPRNRVAQTHPDDSE